MDIDYITVGFWSVLKYNRYVQMFYEFKIGLNGFTKFWFKLVVVVF